MRPTGRSCFALALLLACAVAAQACGDEEPAGTTGAPHVDSDSSGKRAKQREVQGEGGFRIATVRPGRTVIVFERPNGDRAGVAESRTEFGSPTTFSVVGRRGPWLEVTTALAEDNEPRWIRADRREVRLTTTDISIHADLSERRVVLRDAGEPAFSFAVTVGAPGTETPPGQFSVTDVIFGGLKPVYGCCAIALTGHQPNLPPGWIGGDRIAIHGTESGSATASAASAGCLRAADADVEKLGSMIPLGAPVFVAE